MEGRVSSPVLVGRSGELEALQAALAAADNGHPSLTFLGGDAGVGKSRLVRELVRRRRDPSGLVLCGDCVQLSSGELPYGPIASALRNFSHGPSAGSLDDLPSEVRGELARIVPELGAADEDPPDSSAPTDYSQARLFHQLLRALCHLTEQTSVLLILEDLHWADGSTRDFLAFAVRNLHAERLALLVTYRTDELPPTHPLRALLGELVRRDGVVRLELGRLTRLEVGRQLEAISGAPPQSELVDEIFGRSEGNPFLTEELLLARRAGLAGRLPLGLRDTLLARVERLPDETRQVLQVLAAAGRPIGHAVLEAASPLSAPALSAALRTAVSDQVLVRGADGEALRFRHALVGEALNHELLDGERLVLHRRLARALAEKGSAAPAELARHYELAGDAPAAVSASLDAGITAVRGWAFAEALFQFLRALRLWNGTEAGAIDRVDLLGHAAEAARFAGDYEHAMALCRDALDSLDASSDPLRAARFHERLGEYCVLDDHSARASYRRAFDLLTTDQPAERARVLAGEGRACMHLLLWDEARALCEAALELARPVGAEAAEGYARTTLGVALAFIGEHAAGEAHLREARRIVERQKRPDDLARVHVHLAEVLRLRGRIGEALAVMDEGLATSRRLGLEASFGRFMNANAAEDLLRLGRWDEADRRLEDNARHTLPRLADLLHHSVSAQLAAARGDAEAAREHLEPAMALCQEPFAAEFAPGVYAAAAELALWEERTEEARRAISDGLEAIGSRSDPLNTPVLHALGVRVEAEAAVNARARACPTDIHSAGARAQHLVEGLDDVIARHSGTATPPEAVAYRVTCAAELSRLTDTPAPEAWAAAVARWEGLDARYNAAYSQWRLGEALLAVGAGGGPVDQALAAAHRTARLLHARPLAARIESTARLAKVALDRAPVADAESDQAELGTDRGLSTREKQVLVLIADGLTNGEIGSRLFITENSVSVHVSHILLKLDAPNRVTAAAIAHRLGLADATKGASARVGRST